MRFFFLSKNHAVSVAIVFNAVEWSLTRQMDLLVATHQSKEEVIVMEQNTLKYLQDLQWSEYSVDRIIGIMQ